MTARLVGAVVLVAVLPLPLGVYLAMRLFAEWPDCG